jgi:hypothetical protein
MNHSLSVFLINKNCRAVMTRYEPTRPTDKDVMFKTLDPDIKIDDLVVVPTDTRHRFTIVKVTGVGVDVDLDSPTRVDWIVSRVDIAEHKRIVADEATAILKIRAVEFEQRRAKLCETMFSANMDSLKQLNLYANGDDEHAAQVDDPRLPHPPKHQR